MSERSLPKASLLCIDDDQAVLECEKAFLENVGYAVVTASSGHEGLELVGLHSFDVVIVDYCMPEMNGRELAIAMRRIRPLAPIIMLSGSADVPGQALKVVDAFVAKDCLASQLFQPSHYCVDATRCLRFRMTHGRGQLGSQQAPDKKGQLGRMECVCAN
jgi:CheY-like chemotaxis protein